MTRNKKLSVIAKIFGLSVLISFTLIVVVMMSFGYVYYYEPNDAVRVLELLFGTFGIGYGIFELYNLVISD